MGNKVTIKALQGEIQSIKKRNKLVEGEKAWEVSVHKKLTLLVITFILTTIVMYILKIEDLFVRSFLATLGYYLSTLSLSYFKNIYIKKYF